MNWAKRGALGVADQLLSSGTNFGTAFVASAVLDVPVFGTYVMAIVFVQFALTFQRAFMGFPLLSRYSIVPAEERADLVRDAVSAAWAAGLLTGVLAVAVWSSGLPLARDLIWIAPWLPAFVLQDAGRYVVLSAREPAKALLIDGAWAVVQGTIVLVIIATGSGSPASLSAAWGCGALVGAVAFCSLARALPWRGRPRRWIRASLHVSRWTAPTLILAQTRINGAIVVVGGLLGAEAAAGLRVVQLLVAQPIQTLLNAMMVLLVPIIARIQANGRIQVLRHHLLQLNLIFAGCSLLIFLLVPLRYPALKIAFPKYIEAADLVLPLCVQIAFTVATLPSQAALRGLERPRGLLLVHVASTVVVGVGTVVAGAMWGALGVAWALAAGSVVLLVGTSQVARLAIRKAERGAGARRQDITAMVRRLAAGRAAGTKARHAR